MSTSDNQNKMKKRDFSSLVNDRLLAEKKASAKIELHEKVSEQVPLSSVKFNYKNKRVITQIVRFIPDELSELANASGEPEAYILNRLSEVPINSVITEFRLHDKGSAPNSDIVKYQRHDDIYDVENQGVFVGKGICFHNITSEFAGVTELVNEFVEEVTINGKSLEQNKDVVEKPQIMKIGGQRYRLAFGHHRYCYLAYHFGLDHVYKFDMAMSQEKQDLRIFLENNTKKSEKGYEQIQSHYYTALESGTNDLSVLCDILACKKSYLYKLKPFLQDKRLLDCIKKHGFLLSITSILSAMSDAKKALSALGKQKNPDLILEIFSAKLESLSADSKLISKSVPSKDQSNVTAKRKQPMLKTRLPNDKAAIEKLFYGDVRSWSKLDIEQYDLENKKDRERYVSDLLLEMHNQGV